MRYLLMINTGEHWLWLMVLGIWCLAGSFVPESRWRRTPRWKGTLQQGGSPHDNRKQRGTGRKEAGQVVLLKGIPPPTLFFPTRLHFLMSSSFQEQPSVMYPSLDQSWKSKPPWTHHCPTALPLNPAALRTQPSTQEPLGAISYPTHNRSLSPGTEMKN